MSAPTDVVALAINTPRRFYRGGERILAFRGIDAPAGHDDHRPEDWLASTTHLFAEGGGGLSALPDGRTLADALEEDPSGWLGADHVTAHGTEPGILTKLLDAGERLPVHSHPDRAFAAAHLDCAHGKTEAWIVLGAEPGATVWLGFRDDLTKEALAALVDDQGDGLLAALNPLRVEAGDAILVPAGQPHAIGGGVFVLEIQEPTDLSVMLEHARFGLEEAHAFLGLPVERALESVDTRTLDGEARADLQRRWVDVRGHGSALSERADEFFRAEVLASADGAVEGEAGFGVAVCVAGSGIVTTEHGEAAHRVTRGDVLLTPHAAGRIRVDGGATLIRCRPAAVPTATSTPTDLPGNT
ncbi:class I mannose-6-phosphate isomerase [Janibacter sp. G56]|uniref:class I mannose-6-phosphate isomerase n=1 Tax=Janibacter sp. G56 TaxID=3418717 RepID=UPI003CFC6D6B